MVDRTHSGDEEVVFSILLVFPFGPGGVWDGVGIFVGMSRDQTVLDVAAADAVGAQQHQRLPPVRRQLHNLNEFGIIIRLMITGRGWSCKGKKCQCAKKKCINFDL